MDARTDLRIQKTHKKLTVALSLMMSERPFDEITVFDLCERADIRRATFYKHFNDKYDFLKSVITDVIKNIAEVVSSEYNLSSPVEYFSKFVNEIIMYFEARPKILENILHSVTFPILYDTITHCTHSSLIDNLKQAERQGLKIGADVLIVSNFINGGIANLLLGWFKYHDVEKDVLIDQIRIILAKILE